MVKVPSSHGSPHPPPSPPQSPHPQDVPFGPRPRPGNLHSHLLVIQKTQKNLHPHICKIQQIFHLHLLLVLKIEKLASSHPQETAISPDRWLVVVTVIV
jgi:hypothetical protein